VCRKHDFVHAPSFAVDEQHTIRLERNEILEQLPSRRCGVERRSELSGLHLGDVSEAALRNEVIGSDRHELSIAIDD